MKQLIDILKGINGLGHKYDRDRPETQLEVISFGNPVSDYNVTFHIAPAIYTGMITEQWDLLDKVFDRAGIDLQKTEFTKHGNFYEGKYWSLEMASVSFNKSDLKHPSFDTTFFPTQLRIRQGEEYETTEATVVLHYNANAALLLADRMSSGRGYINALTYARALTLPIKTSPEQKRGEVLDAETRRLLGDILEQETSMVIDQGREFGEKERGYNQTILRDVRPEMTSLMPELQRLYQAAEESRQTIERNMGLILEAQFR